METRELTCICCPMGCQLKVELEGDEVISLTGNTCPRGDVYGRKEVVDPTRIVTSTVVVKNGDKARLSVKTANDIPKGKMAEVMKDIDKAVVNAPIKIGDVIIEDVAGTGVAVIATRNITKI